MKNILFLIGLPIVGIIDIVLMITDTIRMIGDPSNDPWMGVTSDYWSERPWKTEKDLRNGYPWKTKSEDS